MQWHRNGAPISGATNLSYTLSGAALTDSGALFRLVASNVVAQVSHVVTSSVASLTVLADTNPPVLLGAQSLGLTQVSASFSERIKLSTATNRANYSITGTNGSLAISTATLDASQTNVMLTVSAMTDGAPYTLHVSNLADQSAAGNVIAPDSLAAFIASVYASAAIGDPTPSGGQIIVADGMNVTGGGADLGGTTTSFSSAHGSDPVTLT